MYFDMYGPFELARTGGAVSGSQPGLWSAVRAESLSYGYRETELETAIGCYAFGLKHGSTLRPWYVGMTVAQGGFRDEILQRHKLLHYNEVVAAKRGMPVLMLMPVLTSEARLSRDRSTNTALIKWVEKMLFGLALKQNPDCRNQRDTKYLRKVEVRGVFNSKAPGPPIATVRAAKQMFGT